MANALLQPYVQGSQHAATCPLYDPRFERAHRSRFFRTPIPGLDLANALYVASGPFPARAWVLVRRSDYNDLNPYATNLQLKVDDGESDELTFSGLTVVQAMCV